MLTQWDASGAGFPDPVVSEWSELSRQVGSEGRWEQLEKRSRKGSVKGVPRETDWAKETLKAVGKSGSSTPSTPKQTHQYGGRREGK